MLNASAVDQAVRTALALGSDVHRRSVFERKHYFYSDLPHGYQITQQRHPIASGGSLPLVFEPATSSPATATNTNTRTRTPATTNAADTADNTTTPTRTATSTERDAAPTPVPLPLSVGITRIQLEVDSGKSLHDSASGSSTGDKNGGWESMVDLNRAGTALMEIVFEPEIRSAAEAGAALRSLQLLLRKLRSCDGNMEDGSMRCDLNVSVRPAGGDGMGVRVEMKNMNSVRHLMTAAAFEAQRQVRKLELGAGPVERETRGFDVTKVCLGWVVCA